MSVAPGAYWDLLDRHTPNIKRRATHAKARTGCLTCKRRKVKCDEAKPHCARCVKSGHECAGYEEGRSGSGAARKGADTADHDTAQPRGSRSRHPDRCAPAPLRPKLGAAAVRASTTAVGVLPSSAGIQQQGATIDLLRASMTPMYFDVGDAMYFERFKSQVLADVGTWCGSEYWRHRVLGEVLLNKTVQHAALASVAMIMDIEQQQQFAYARLSRKREREREGRPPSVAEEDLIITSQPSETLITSMLKNKVDRGQEERRQDDDEDASLLPVTSPSNITTHGKAALRHYTTSISLCRQSLAAEGITSATARPSLTATFFYAILELVQGNVSGADQILSSGVSLLDNALSTQVSDGRPAVAEDDELREIQIAFDRMRVTWGLCPYFGGKYRDNNNNNSNNENNDTRLLAMISRTPARHFELPSPDASVRTKQMFWNAFSSDFGQFMVDMQDMLYPSSPLSPPFLSAPQTCETISAIMAQRTKYLIQLRYWLPILSDLCAQDPGSTILATTKAYAQTAIIFLNCFLDRTELAYDAYLPIFRDIVSAYEHLLPSSSPSHSPSPSSSFNTPPSTTHTPPPRGLRSHLRITLDVDLFHIITFTVSKCRDKTTRAAALRVFARMTRHQALWTNSGMLVALRALSDLEDAGRVSSSCTSTSSSAATPSNDSTNNSDNSSGGNGNTKRDGFVPPQARYRYVSSEWDFQSRRMVAVFLPVMMTNTTSMESGTASVAAVRVPIEF